MLSINRSIFQCWPIRKEISFTLIETGKMMMKEMHVFIHPHVK